MSEELFENCNGECECAQKRKVLLAALLLGGAALIAGGILCWQATPDRRTDRLLSKAERKVSEIEDFLTSLAE